MFLRLIYLLWVGVVNAVIDALEGEDPRADPPTGIANRKHIMRRLKAELKYASRRKQPICVVFVDLDRLKQINDSEGHKKGDSFIKRVTIYVKASVQRFLDLSTKEVIDFFGRYGGDEFIIILRHTTLAKAEAFMADLERRGGERKMSFGIAEQSPGEQKSSDQMIKEADAKMYRHKESRPARKAWARN